MKKIILVAGILVSLSGCGGGGGGDNNTTPAVNISGTAAAGAAIIGQVTVKGSAGVSISTEIEADGSYSVDVSGLVAPYMLRAVGSVGGKEYTLYSFAEETDVGGTINITPFTDLILSNVAGELASNHFEDGDFRDFKPEEIEEQEDALQDKLSKVLSALGVGDAIDLLRTQFSTDHSGLDAVLDIIRIETDPETSIATITNFIDGQSIEDDISDPKDIVTPLVVEDSEALSSAQVDLLAMANKVTALSSLFASGLPQTSQLDGLFATDTLNDDEGKSQLLTDISTSPSLVGISFGNVTYDDYDQEAGTSIVQFTITQNGEVDSELIRWYMAKNEGVWQFRGNQEIADISVGFICYYSPADGSTGCGVNVGVEDNDFSNTPGAVGSPIQSAKFTIMREGTLVPDSDIYLGLPDGYSAGELQVYDEDYGDDFMGFGSTWSDIPASIFQAGDVAKIELFTEALDISSLENPQIDPSATPVQTVTRIVVAAPVSQASVSMFPTVTDETVTDLAQYSDGDLDVEWSVPTGFSIDEIRLEAIENGDSVRVEDNNLSGASGTATLTLDTSSLNTSESNFTKELWLYSKNSSGQNFLTTYDADGVEILSDTSIPDGFTTSWIAGRTLYSVRFGLGEDDQGSELDDVVVRNKFMGSDDGTSFSFEGLLNSNNNSEQFEILITGIFMHSTSEPASAGIKIVCGSMEGEYIKVHSHKDNGDLHQVMHWFFSESAAMNFASTLTSEISPCAE
jgi:hypothetical protein